MVVRAVPICALFDPRWPAVKGWAFAELTEVLAVSLRTKLFVTL
jgi:hypothetical protein